jgi:hypothetical protein
MLNATVMLVLMLICNLYLLQDKVMQIKILEQQYDVSVYARVSRFCMILFNYNKLNYIKRMIHRKSYKDV